MKNSVLLIVIFLSVIFSGVGCTTVSADRFPVQGTLTTTAHDKPETDTFNLTREAAKLKLELAKIRAKVEIAKAEAQADAEKAKARAANPCASWFFAPSYCYPGMVVVPGQAYGGNTSVYGYGTNTPPRHVHNRSCRH